MTLLEKVGECSGKQDIADQRCEGTYSNAWLFLVMWIHGWDITLVIVYEE